MFGRVNCTHTRTQTHTQTHRQTNTQTHTHTHTHTHTVSMPASEGKEKSFDPAASAEGSAAHPSENIVVFGSVCVVVVGLVYVRVCECV